MAQTLSSRLNRTFSQNYQGWLIRIFDVLICGMSLPLLIPCFGVIAAAIKLTSSGPVFFISKRIGQDGKTFYMYKFRSMYVGAERSGPGITVKNDSRVTPFGHWLRRLKLDELPQIINVLMGDMSLVGPRPEDPRYIVNYPEDQKGVLSIRPGITSLASIYYRDEAALLEGDNWESKYIKIILPRKLAIDSYFVQNYTLKNYFSVLCITVLAFVKVFDAIEYLSKLRNRHVLAIDVILLSVTPLIALAFWSIAPNEAIVLYTSIALALKLFVFYHFGLYKRYWQYSSVSDLGAIVSAVFVTTVVLFTLVAVYNQFFKTLGLEVFLTLPLLDGLLTGVATTADRLSLRVFAEWGGRFRPVTSGRHVMIVGAGHAGRMVLNEIKANPELGLTVLAFVDDNPAKIGTKILGVPIVASTSDIAKCVSDYAIQRLIVAMPTVPNLRRKEIWQRCKATGVETYIVPGMYELLAGYKTINPVPTVDITQLIQRPSVVADKTEVAQLIADATVLVTGAGGSIGRELCRQIAQLGPERLILLGHGENSIFETGMELRTTFPNLVIHQVIADVRDSIRINQVIDQFRPKIIYHAAAHKHVPLMQSNLEEVITNNVLGTRTVLRAAERFDVEYFILISTDKAINPTSMMGASKRIAELLVKSTAKRTGKAYKAVRFGNVLGSRGSVIPIFQRQIAAGGPVTITHPDMTRYFMTIPEAVQLVLQATVVGHSGDVFVLDMGKPVRILELAQRLIQLSGAKTGEINIVYSGIRPGEKLHEELFQKTEHYERTKYEKIFVATDKRVALDQDVEDMIACLIDSAQQMNTEAVIRYITAIVPTFQPESDQQPITVTIRTEALEASNGYSLQQGLAAA